MIQLWAPSSGETREFIQRATLTVHYGLSLAVECTSVVHSFLWCIVGLNECTRERGTSRGSTSESQKLNKVWENLKDLSLGT